MMKTLCIFSVLTMSSSKKNLYAKMVSLLLKIPNELFIKCNEFKVGICFIESVRRKNYLNFFVLSHECLSFDYEFLSHCITRRLKTLYEFRRKREFHSNTYQNNYLIKMKLQIVCAREEFHFSHSNSHGKY